MDNKITTIFLAILLVILVILMFLRACAVGPWHYRNKIKTPKSPEDQISTTVKKETNASVLEVKPEITDDEAGRASTVEPVPENQKQNQQEPNKQKQSEELTKTSSKPQSAAKSKDSNTFKTKTAESPKISKQELSKPSGKTKSSAKPKAEKAAASKPGSKQEISRQDLPKPAVKKRPAREKISKPVFTNKSGFKPFYVYADIGSKNNHYSPYGLMGDISSISMEQGHKVKPHSGKTCIKVTYRPAKGKVGWSGVYWTEPPNNWGDKGYGFNLTGAERISFWARGEKGTEIIDNFIMGGIKGKKHEDSDSVAIGPVELSTEWKHYFINIEGADLSNIIGGFCFTVTKINNPMGAVFYLDDIVYE